ncbi:MAG: IS200/IS605 family transposase [Candidatus Azobacteroides sp.]|nr:IS200/IS605 family transposase [Candidatus Azobacteroides sp.]
MANTYTRLYIHIIFSVKERACLIEETFREELQRYICGTTRHYKCKSLAIYCNPDHTHILLSIKPYIGVADIVRVIKSMSSKYINEQNLTPYHFHWQDGYSAFSCSYAEIEKKIVYILNQPRHHKTISFEEEYKQHLREFGVLYDEKYVFD